MRGVYDTYEGIGDKNCDPEYDIKRETKDASSAIIFPLQLLEFTAAYFLLESNETTFSTAVVVVVPPTLSKWMKYCFGGASIMVVDPIIFNIV